MWRCRHFLLAWILLAGSGCGVAEPVPPPPADQVTTEAWTLRFQPAGGSGLVKLEHHLIGTVAELHDVRLVLGREAKTVHLGLQAAERRGDTLVVTCTPLPDHAVELRIRLRDEGNADVEVVDRVSLRSEVREITLDYVLPELIEPEETWLPQQHAGSEQVAGDGAFHAPVAFVRRGEVAVALLPDVEQLQQSRRIPQALEFDRGYLAAGIAPRLRHGLITHRPGADGGFTRTGPVAVQGETLRFGHRIRLFATADQDTSDQVFRDLWTESRAREARRSGIAHKTNHRSLDAAARAFFPVAASRSWFDLSHGKGEAGMFRADLARRSDGLNGADAWFSVCQQSLRTAYGALLFGKRTNQPALVDKAGQVLAFALLARHRGGLVPALCVVDEATGARRWHLDSKRHGDPDRYHSIDAATTALWMLRLSAHLPAQRHAVHALCNRTARFFQANQRASGAFPNYFADEFLEPGDGADADTSAETGAVARFLIAWGARTGDDAALAAARRALDHIESLLRRQAWLDFESHRPGTGPGRDPRSGAPRQGTLGLIQCALAAAEFGKLRPAPKWRRLTDRLLGQLARYQQVWTPAFVPGAAFGGFGAGNFTHRWNDARASLAALAFFKGFALTGDHQWLDRGTAALDAAVAAGDREYQPPEDHPGPRGSVHWGPGSAATVAEIARETFASGVIDMYRKRLFGVDALWMADYELDAERLELRILTRARDLDRAVLRFRNIPPQIKRLTVLANRQAAGTFTPAELRAGIPVRTTLLPSVTFAPPHDLSSKTAWFPRALFDQVPDTVRNVHAEVHVGGEEPEVVPMVETGGVFLAKDGFRKHNNLPDGTAIYSALRFEVNGAIYSVPPSGYFTSRVGDGRSIDAGDGDELELSLDEGSRVRRFLDGTENSRHASGAARFAYRIPIRSKTSRLEIKVRVAGQLRIRVDDLVLHEDPEHADASQPRELELALSDRRLWASGALELTFEPRSPQASVDLARFRYIETGELQLDGMDPVRKRREPARELRVVVQPFALLDRPLGVDREALRGAFFGADYSVTPAPASRHTTGSVAQLIERLSGGRTMCRGVVLPRQTWETVDEDARRKAPLPAAFVAQLRSAHEDADVVVAIVGRGGPVPGPRSVHLAGREVPVVFLPVRNAQNEFLANGTATAAILEACYDARPLRGPDRGNFGILALSGTDSHAPMGPPTINLSRAGWSDHLVLQHRDYHDLVLAPLEAGRVGLVLDHDTLPGLGGRGALFVECRRTGTDATGLLLYWSFTGERPRLRDRDGRVATPSILRLSAQHARTDTPFQRGTRADLYRHSMSRLPTRTPTGERLWELRDLRLFENGHATFDARYLGRDLLERRLGAWFAGEQLTPVTRIRRFPKDAIRADEDETQLTLREGDRFRLQTKLSSELRRVFARVRGVRGEGRLRLGSGEQVLAEIALRGVTGQRWLQADVPSAGAVWLEVENTGKEAASVVLNRLFDVPRELPLHAIHPPRLQKTGSVRLMDGVTYAESIRLPARSRATTTKTALVLPSGPVAIRLRGGLRYDAPVDAMANLTVTLVDKKGRQRTPLLQDYRITNSGARELLLSISRVPDAEEDRVEFLELTWSGNADIHLVDFAVIRP